MQVQSIQTTNDCRKPCFKARFVNDSKNILARIWNSSIMTNKLENDIDIFVKKHPEHSLEIISADGAKFSLVYYTILNQYTGKVCQYLCEDIPIKDTLSFLLEKINKDEDLFENNQKSKSYRILTGQEKPDNGVI